MKDPSNNEYGPPMTDSSSSTTFVADPLGTAILKRRVRSSLGR